MTPRHLSDAAEALGPLLAPLDPHELPALMRNRVPKLVRGAGSRDLPGWAGLREALADGTIPRRYFRLMRDNAKVSEMFFSSPEALRMERIDQLLGGGCSVLLDRLDRSMDPLRLLTDGIRAWLGEYVTAIAVVTTGARGAFDLHYDEEDILVLQVEGTKSWQLFAPTLRNVLKQGPAAPMPQGAPLLEVDLHAGDMLFVPAGYWHQCTNRAERSVHYSAMIMPLSVNHVVKALHERLLADEEWRRPLGRSGGDSADEAALKAHLGDLVESLSLAELRRARLVRGRAPDGGSAD